MCGDLFVLVDRDFLGLVVGDFIFWLNEVDISYFIVFLKYYLFLICIFCGLGEDFFDDIDFYIIGLYE